MHFISYLRRTTLFLSVLLISNLLFAEGSESLQNVTTSVYGTSSSYSFTGDNGMTWNTVGAIESSTGGYRTLTVSAGVAGNGITGRLNSQQVSEGLGEISFYVKGMRSGSGYGDRTFRVSAGDVTTDVVVNIPSMTNSYKVTATIKRRNVSAFTITALESVSDETATFGLYNFTWTSYNGKTDKPTFSVDDSSIEYGVEGLDTVYYSPSSVSVTLASTTDGATFYYTTDGSAPTTSSAAGSIISLPAGQNYTVRAIAWTSALGMSDELQFTIKTRRGNVFLNPASNLTIWPENSTLYSYSNANYLTKSNAPCYRLPGSGTIMTPVVVCPKHFSVYATSSTRQLTIAYQVGTYSVDGSTQTWEGGEWNTLDEMSVTNGKFVSGVMKRFDIALPSAIQDKFVKFRLTASGNSVYVDDINYIAAAIEQLATPTLSVASGEVASGQTVIISGPAGSTLYYTINGGAPQQYTAPITINGPTELRAYASKSGYADSWSAKATYTVANVQPTLNTPVFSLSAGNVNWGSQLTITADNFATLHYAVNGGAEQTALGTVTLTLTENTAITAYATCNGYTNSATATANYTVVYPTLSAPTFSIESGNVMSGTQLTITAETGATIVYTINGGSNQLALSSATVSITRDMTIVAYAQREGYTNSVSISRHYTVTYPKLASPTFSVPSGAVAQGTLVEIRGQKGDTLYYTTNGSTWTRALAMATVTISQACTLSAYLCHSGYLNSDTISASYTISAVQAAAPYFSIDEGTYERGTRFALSAEEGATIHYSINENEEQTAVTEVIFTLTENMEITAYATQEGYTQSPTVQAAFYVREVPTDTEMINPENQSVRKYLHNGHIVIETADGLKLTVLGQRYK